jgi:hypothetical protein
MWEILFDQLRISRGIVVRIPHSNNQSTGLQLSASNKNNLLSTAVSGVFATTQLRQF